MNLKYSEAGSLSYKNISFKSIFYNSISLLSQIPQSSSSVPKSILKQVKQNYTLMQSLADSKDVSGDIKLLIIGSLVLQLDGDFNNSISILDQAIKMAENTHSFSDKILACELAASFSQSRGFQDIAANYLTDAEETRKRQEMPLLDNNNETEYVEYKNIRTSKNTTLQELDLTTVIQSSHIISGEIIIERLFEKLLLTLLENAGATRVLLILQRNDELLVEASGTPADIEILKKPAPVEEYENLPLSIINFVKRSNETIVVNTPSRKGMFSSDPYIINSEVGSILSFPLLKQTNLMGIIYLENNLVPDAFLPDRVELIKLISTQAAISLENALLFEKERNIEMELQEQYEEIQAQYEEMEAMNEELKGTTDELFLANKSLAIFQKFTNESAQGMGMTDLNGNLTYANEVLISMLGKKNKDEVTGNNLSRLYPHDIQENLFRSILNEVIKGREWLGELQIRSADNQAIPVIQGFFTIKNERGDPQYIATIITDISDQKRLKEQLLQAQKMEAIGTLAGGIAHDFNNILTAIIGYCDLILGDIESSDSHYQNIKEIHKAAMRSSSMTHQLLAFSRKQMLMPKILNINTIVSEMIIMLSRLIGENIKLHTFLMDDINAIDADPGQIEQVIMNLVVNARDAVPDGGSITITTGNKIISPEDVESIPNSRPGTFTCLTIEDNGSGIDQDTLEKIFEPFFTTKDMDKGTGLGLSVVYGIIAQHNGWINVTSSIGNGTAFHIYIPSVERTVVKETTRKSLNSNIMGKGEKILLIEDQPEVIRFINKALSDNGYIVFMANSGNEAKSIFQKHKGEFDLIFSDVVLPDISGLELIDYFHLNKPDIAVLLSSGYSDEMSQWETIREKDINFLEKPYSLNKLLNMVADLFNK